MADEFDIGNFSNYGGQSTLGTPSPSFAEGGFSNYGGQSRAGTSIGGLGFDSLSGDFGDFGLANLANNFIPAFDSQLANELFDFGPNVGSVPSSVQIGSQSFGETPGIFGQVMDFLDRNKGLKTALGIGAGMVPGGGIAMMAANLANMARNAQMGRSQDANVGRMFGGMMGSSVGGSQFGEVGSKVGGMLGGRAGGYFGGGGDRGTGALSGEIGADISAGGAEPPWMTTTGDPLTDEAVGLGPAGGGGGATGPGGMNFANILQSLGGAKGLGTSLLNIGSGLYGMRQAGKIAERADPFAGQRAEYGARLRALEADPSSLTRTPGYEAGLQAVQRSLAAQGFTGSGNAMIELQKYGGDAYNREVARLAGLAGAGATPGAGQELATSTMRRGLSSIGQGIGPLLERMAIGG